jgi:hypothetical protein
MQAQYIPFVSSFRRVFNNRERDPQFVGPQLWVMFDRVVNAHESRLHDGSVRGNIFFSLQSNDPESAEQNHVPRSRNGLFAENAEEAQWTRV